MPIHSLIVPGFTWALTLAMALVVRYDAARYLIPNWLNGAVVALYLLAIPVLAVAPLSALAAAGLVLVIGLGIFALGLIGGGDVKLLAALTLWTGWGAATVQFLVLTALVGGALVVFMLLLRATLPRLWLTLCPTRTCPRLFTRGQPVPYGLAIAPAFLWMLWAGSVPGL